MMKYTISTTLYWHYVKIVIRFDNGYVLEVIFPRDHTRNRVLTLLYTDDIEGDYIGRIDRRYDTTPNVLPMLIAILYRLLSPSQFNMVKRKLIHKSTVETALLYSELFYFVWQRFEENDK